MNSADKKLWLVALAGPAQKSLKNIPSNDRARIRLAIDGMEENPFLGDVRKLKGGGRGSAAVSVIGAFSSTSTPKDVVLS
jgi:phage-related protein